jgi:hypothetical protein
MAVQQTRIIEWFGKAILRGLRGADADAAGNLRHCLQGCAECVLASIPVGAEQTRAVTALRDVYDMVNRAFRRPPESRSHATELVDELVRVDFPDSMLDGATDQQVRELQPLQALLINCATKIGEELPDAELAEEAIRRLADVFDYSNRGVRCAALA